MELVDVAYIGFFGVMVYSAVLWLLVYARNRDAVHADPAPERFPGVTFLVPAYNEEDYIEDTIEGLLALDYPAEKLDIIAINDGSTDGTLEKLQRYADRITIIDKENTGKANSLNRALERVETEVVACMDADSVPEPDFLQRMVGWFGTGEAVEGVTPAMKVRNARNWVQKIQWTEYIFQIFLRKVFAVFDTQYVLPGPGSLYRTETLREMGGWNEETLTEDMEIAFRIVANGGIIENSTNAYVETVAPDTLKGLFRQRIRWYRGYIENMRSYWEMFGNRKYGNLGLFLLPFNVVWIGLVLFFLLHFTYNIAFSLYQALSTFLLVGYLQPSFALSLQDLHLFHLFSGFFLLLGAGTILISLRVSNERIHLWKRKTHYSSFLLLYPFLFALFWIAAFREEIGRYEGRW